MIHGNNIKSFLQNLTKKDKNECFTIFITNDVYIYVFSSSENDLLYVFLTLKWK